MQELIDSLGFVPRTAVWEITRACDLRCGHCGSSAGKPRAGELSTGEGIRLVRDLARLGCRHLTLSGGEPTARDDWPDFARAAADQGMTVNLVTNGQSIASDLGSKARTSGLANVAVSLDGLEPTHDALRGLGTFQRALATIRSLVSSDVWVDVMLTVNRQNLGELGELYDFVGELGVRRLRAQLGKPMGSQTNRTDLTLAPRHLLELMPRLGKLQRPSGPRVFLGDSLGFFSPEERRLRGDFCDQGHWTGCYAGCQAIGIQSDGGIKGCLSLQPRAGELDPFLEGNVRAEPLADIWLRPGAFAYNRSPDHRLGGACARCAHRTLCRGGAKCVAYAYTGGMAHDPMCYLAVARRDARFAQRFWPASAAAAALALGMAAPGCGGETSPSQQTGGSGNGGAPSGGTPALAGNPGSGGFAHAGSATGGANVQGGSAATGGVAPRDAGLDAIDCSTVCCMCDYGIIPPDYFQACCMTNPGP
jgi:radical SAM protein with 4Fe4S-binding SPASM domain